MRDGGEGGGDQCRGGGEGGGIILVEAGYVGIGEVAVGIHFRQRNQAEPAEVLVTEGAGHFVAAFHLLQKREEKRHLKYLPPFIQFIFKH